MLVNNEYGHLFHKIGVEDRRSQEIVLEYIFNLARIGIECVNNHCKTSIKNEQRG